MDQIFLILCIVACILALKKIKKGFKLVIVILLILIAIEFLQGRGVF